MNHLCQPTNCTTHVELHNNPNPSTYQEKGKTSKLIA